MGKPTPSSHSSTLSSKLLLMIRDASETLLAKEEADRISADLANNVRDGVSRKRKRVEGGVGGGVLAELAEDLDVEDERAKALVSALVRHIRLKRRPPPPNPSLLVRPSSNIDHLLSRSSLSRPESSAPSSSSARPRSLLPQPRSGGGPLSIAQAAVRDLTSTLAASPPRRNPTSSSSTNRPHFGTHSPDFAYPLPGYARRSRSPITVNGSSSSSSALQPLGPPLASSSSGSIQNSSNTSSGSDDQQPEPQATPLSPPWQPAHELHIAPETLESYRIFRADYLARNPPPPPPHAFRRHHHHQHHPSSSPYHSPGFDAHDFDQVSRFGEELLDARSLGLGPLAVGGSYYEEESGSGSGSEGEREGGGDGPGGLLNDWASERNLGDGMLARLEMREAVQREREERSMARAERRQRVPQISISLSPPPAGAGAASGSGLSSGGGR